MTNHRSRNRIAPPPDSVATTAVAAGLAGLWISTRTAWFAIAVFGVLVVAQPLCYAQGAAGQVAAAAGGAGTPLSFGTGLESGAVVRGSDGTAYLVVDLAAAAAPVAVTRPGMAVALVIDRSGSMHGAKMEQAITAASSFIGGMADGDIVAIYQYDDVVNQLAPPTVVSPQTRSHLVSTVHRIRARGSTNLHGGLVAGIASLAAPGAERPVRRVILISDGLANVGPSTPAAIGGEAARAAMSGISVTSVGVGVDYDEAVLASVAIQSGGRFYHLRDPAQMAGILTTELNSLASTVARQVWVDVTPAPGVRFVDATGAHVIRRGRGARLRVGDMLGGQSRPVVVTLRLPTNGQADRSAATVALHYEDAQTGMAAQRETTVGYSLAATQEDADRAINAEYAVAVERHRAAMATQEAARLVGAGRADAAGDALDRQASRIRRRAQTVGGAAGARMQAEADQLQSRGRRARRARSAPARRAASLELNDDALGGLGY